MHSLIAATVPTPLLFVVGRPRGGATTIVSTPCALSSGTSAFTVSASSRKSTCEMPAGETIDGVPSSVMPMNATLHAAEALDRVRREDRLAGRLVLHVGGEELEVGALERVAVLAAVDGMAAAVLHAQELGDALVELVVADAVEVEAEQVQRLDRRLVVEQRREERRGADEVAGRDDDACSGSSSLSSLTCVARYSTPPAR